MQWLQASSFFCIDKYILETIKLCVAFVSALCFLFAISFSLLTSHYPDYPRVEYFMQYCTLKISVFF